MRPPKVKRSSLRYPLDVIFGSQANIRLMRVLVHEVDLPVSVEDAARMAGLSVPGTRNALENLTAVGAAVRVGSGRALKYGPNESTAFFPHIRTIYDAEQRQYEDLLGALRSALGFPEIQEAWLRTLPMNTSEPFELDIVVEVSALSWISSEVRSRLLETEKSYNVIVEIHVYTEADDPTAPEHAITLRTSGLTASESHRMVPDTRMSSEARSRRMAEVIAQIIQSNPSLIKKAIRYLDLLLREGQGTANLDLAEWKQLLETYSQERVIDLLLSESSRSVRLRRSSPFFAVLTAEEREKMLETLEGEQ